jgi:hypothetical protein
VVLVTIDGARWEDVLPEADDAADGMMPSLRRLVRERGVALGGPGCDHDVRASGPNFVSLPGYLEMFTGRPSKCTSNACGRVSTATVLDEAREAAHRLGDVAVFASWSKYGSAVSHDPGAIVLSAGARVTPLVAAREDDTLKSLLDGGAAHSGYPGWGDYRPDVHTARAALRYLETVNPRVLVVGLGDSDEQAHRGNVAGYRRALRSADGFIDELDRVLTRMGDVGRQTAVVVTTDHGRARGLRSHGAAFPESQRVFVAAFGAGIAHRGEACAGEDLRLAHIAGALRALLSLGGDGDRGPLASEIVAGLGR